MLEERVPRLGWIAGVPAMPGFTAPKLLWVARHEPDSYARVATVLLPKDYVRYRLTGELVTDLSDAAGTLWLDQAHRRWSPQVLEATGLSEAQLPRLVEGSEPAGVLRSDIAREWGLPDGVVVAGGAGDAAAGAVGIGAVSDRDAFISLGTSGQYFVSTATYRPFPEAFIHAFCHALPQRWFQMAALLNGASSLAWAAKLVGATDIDALLARVEAQYRGAGSVLFLPYLAGERTPHNDPYAKGVFFGLSADTSDRSARSVGARGRGVCPCRGPGPAGGRRHPRRAHRRDRRRQPQPPVDAHPRQRARKTGGSSTGRAPRARPTARRGWLGWRSPVNRWRTCARCRQRARCSSPRLPWSMPTAHPARSFVVSIAR